MESEHSITQFLDGLKTGDSVAAQKVWERYFDQLIRLANQKLKSSPRRVLSEEDVVQVAFENFFRQVQSGRFPKLDDRDDLWQVLAMLIDRKSKDQIKRINAQRAGNHLVHGDSINQDPNQPPILEQAVDLVPTAETGIELAETFEAKLDELPSEQYRQVALLKLEGFTNKEIAEQLDTALRNIERRLSEIRKIWSDTNDDQ